jgi:hypothetical protein
VALSKTWGIPGMDVQKVPVSVSFHDAKACPPDSACEKKNNLTVSERLPERSTSALSGVFERAPGT